MNKPGAVGLFLLYNDGSYQLTAMEHYVCKGSCCMVSETPGVCATGNCDRRGERLESCDCADGNHGESEL